MKKLFSLLLVVVLGLTLVGCGETKAQTMTATIEEPGFKIVQLFEAKGDKVQTLTQTTTVDLAGYDEASIEQVKEEMKKYEAEYGAVEGTEYSYEIKDNVLTEVVKMQLGDKEKLQSLIAADLIPVDEKDADYISLEASAEDLKSNGWTVEGLE